ncbi:AGRG6 protein, partial [Amia calva]|nr:AGRG6 protein [Amia calva]
DCRKVLTASAGYFTSPCYPSEYPNSQACRWTLQAFSGFIMQITFLDFELEEALGCIYDRIVISNGKSDVKLCGITAKSLTFNSTGNIMNVSFNSDFSVQKKGFNISYRQVAVSLRNQKVSIPQNKDTIEVSSLVTIPTLQQFTFCFETARSARNTKDWVLFSYMDQSSNDILTFGIYSTNPVLKVLNQDCLLQNILSEADFSTQMKLFCITWDSSTGTVAVYTPGNYKTYLCGNSIGVTIQSNGKFILGTQDKKSESFNGDIYNLRLWNSVMSNQQLTSLTCDKKGDIFDWENEFWVIPSAHIKTESTLSCICYPSCTNLTTPTPSSGTSTASPTAATTTSCTSSGFGCPATLTPTTSIVITNMTDTNSPSDVIQSTSTLPPVSTNIPTANSTAHEPSPIKKEKPVSLTIPSMTITSQFSTTNYTSINPGSTESIVTPQEPAFFRAASHNETYMQESTKLPPFDPTSEFTWPTKPAGAAEESSLDIESHAITGITVSFKLELPPFTSPLVEDTLFGTSVEDSQSLENWLDNLGLTSPSESAFVEGVFYRISFVVYEYQTEGTDLEVEQAVAVWLNQTFQNWTYTVYVANVSVQFISSLSSRNVRSATKRYICQALLIYKYNNDILLQEEAIQTRLVTNNKTMGGGLVLDTVAVQPVENCDAEEDPFHYKWPESRPTVSQSVPCFPNKAQNASRTCMLNLQNYTSYWAPPDLSNCTDNAADVATQLVDITNYELTTEEVTKIVTKLKEIINVARINASLATTVVTVFSNVLTSSDTALAASSPLALKTVDELALKIHFDEPFLRIPSKNLALGISALNYSTFNGTSFSATAPGNASDLQVNFKMDQQDSMAVVTLPSTLLSNLSETDIEAVSRIQFTFFSKTGLFQDEKSNGHSLNSFVVATSVGNVSISNLQDPVRIQIQHIHYQSQPKPVCVFWDFTIKNGSGGWNTEGCTVSPESNGNQTICLCNHLTHFGVLMDISGTAHQIDAQNTKILTFITYIGCGISAIFSAATLLTYIAFEKLRRDYPSKILMNLSTSLLFLNMVFLLDGWLASFNVEGLCVAVAVFLHFFLLTSFTWMGLESIHMYIALVKVFNTYIRRYILKFCIVGWGLPAVIVAIVVAIDRKAYGKEYYGKGENGQSSSEFCWVKNQVVFYVTCVGYFSIMFLMNVAMFIVVMMQICGRNGKRSNRTLREEILRNLRSVVSLTFLLGMTWGFAFFAWGPVNLAFMYLFSIFNSLQGLFIFIFHCALKENVQKQWRRYLCCGRFRLADNSDWSKTATNNTKKVSSDNLGKSLSSSSIGSTTANWTSKAKSTLNPFSKQSSNTDKMYPNQNNPKFNSVEVDPTSIIPVHQVIDKVKGYCSVRSDNFYKNIIMSDSFSHSTKF